MFCMLAKSCSKCALQMWTCKWFANSDENQKESDILPGFYRTKEICCSLQSTHPMLWEREDSSSLL